MNVSYPIFLKMPILRYLILYQIQYPHPYLYKIVLKKQVNKPSSIKRSIALFSSSIACLLRPTADNDLNTFSIEKKKKEDNKYKHGFSNFSFYLYNINYNKKLHLRF